MSLSFLSFTVEQNRVLSVGLQKNLKTKIFSMFSVQMGESRAHPVDLT